MMNRKKLLFTLPLLAMMSVVACSSDDENHRTEIPQVEASSELKEFMYAILPDYVSYFGEGFPFITSFDDNGRPRPLIVNSQADFERFFRTEDSNSSQFPQIDFEKYSFVVGMVFYLSEKRVPEKSLGQKLYKSGNEYLMELNYAYQTSFDVFSTTYLTYWGLYPKLNNLPIKSNINYIK